MSLEGQIKKCHVSFNLPKKNLKNLPTWRPLMLLIYSNSVSTRCQKDLSRGHVIFWSPPELMPHTICVGRDLKGLWADCGQGAPLGLVQQSHFLKPGILFLGCVLSWIRFHEKLLLVCRTGGKTQCPLPSSAATNAGWAECRRPSFTVGLGLIQPSKPAGSWGCKKASL